METTNGSSAIGRVGLFVLAGLLVLAAGCKTRHEAKGAATTNAARVAVEPRAPAVTGKLVDGPPPVLRPTLKFVPADGLRSPTGVVHDEEADFYLLSNVDGAPLAADGKGFISKLDPAGGRLHVRWIDSGKNNVVLNAPKGMAIRGDELFVADIDTVRIFHRRSGLPLGEIKLPGTKSLTDVVLAQDGGLLVSDRGLKADGERLEESGLDSIYVIYRDDHSSKTTLLARDPQGPTSLFATPTKIWSVASRSGELFSIDEHGKLGDFEKLPGEKPEGIVGIGDDLLVSSRGASAILRGKSKGDWRVAIGDVKDAEHIGYDEKRKRVLVPLTTENEFRIYALE
jgi:hypothetical protein